MNRIQRNDLRIKAAFGSEEAQKALRDEQQGVSDALKSFNDARNLMRWVGVCQSLTPTRIKKCPKKTLEFYRENITRLHSVETVRNRQITFERGIYAIDAELERREKNAPVEAGEKDTAKQIRDAVRNPHRAGRKRKAQPAQDALIERVREIYKGAMQSGKPMSQDNAAQFVIAEYRRRHKKAPVPITHSYLVTLAFRKKRG